MFVLLFFESVMCGRRFGGFQNVFSVIENWLPSP